MDKTTRSDLIILVAGLAGVVGAAILKSLRNAESTAAQDTPMSVPLPELLATVTILRRGGTFAGWYPNNSLALGIAGLVVGAGVGLASGRIRSFLPRAG